MRHPGHRGAARRHGPRRHAGGGLRLLGRGVRARCRTGGGHGANRGHGGADHRRRREAGTRGDARAAGGRRRGTPAPHRQSPRAAGAGRRAKQPPVVPLFVLGFLALGLLRSTGWLPQPVLDGTALCRTSCWGWPCSAWAPRSGSGNCCIPARRPLLAALRSWLLIAGLGWRSLAGHGRRLKRSASPPAAWLIGRVSNQNLAAMKRQPAQPITAGTARGLAGLPAPRTRTRRAITPKRHHLLRSEPGRNRSGLHPRRGPLRLLNGGLPVGRGRGRFADPARQPAGARTRSPSPAPRCTAAPGKACTASSIRPTAVLPLHPVRTRRRPPGVRQLRTARPEGRIHLPRHGPLGLAGGLERRRDARTEPDSDARAPAAGTSRPPRRCPPTSPRSWPGRTSRPRTPGAARSPDGTELDVPLALYCRASMAPSFDPDACSPHQERPGLLQRPLRLPVPVGQVRAGLRARVQPRRHGEPRPGDLHRELRLHLPGRRRAVPGPRQHPPARDGAHVVR